MCEAPALQEECALCFPVEGPGAWLCGPVDLHPRAGLLRAWVPPGPGISFVRVEGSFLPLKNSRPFGPKQGLQIEFLAASEGSASRN